MNVFFKFGATALCCAALLAACGGGGDELPITDQNRYQQTNFVANVTSYQPQFSVEPDFINAWGLAIRPAGAGGHFWVTASHHSYEYVGDVNGQPLSQDALKKVSLAGIPTDNRATATVYNATDDHFKITQTHPNGAITNAAKFLFAADNGVISAWTERKNSDGSFDRPDTSLVVIDQSAAGKQYFGLALSPQADRLYVANFGVMPRIEVFNSAFQEVTDQFGFKNPFANDTNHVQPGEYAPFNVQVLQDRVFVTYAQTSEDPAQLGKVSPGEESAGEGKGRLAEFDLDGNLVAVWDDAGKLNAPWGLALAPDGFGLLRGTLLVGNFGDGTIVAFDRNLRKPVNYVRDANAQPVVIEGLWSILFGNGESLGDRNALYFAAGPQDETDGLFGVLRYTPQ